MLQPARFPSLLSPRARCLLCEVQEAAGQRLLLCTRWHSLPIIARACRSHRERAARCGAGVGLLPSEGTGSDSSPAHPGPSLDTQTTNLLMHRSFIALARRLDARATTSMDALDVGQEPVSKLTQLEACKGCFLPLQVSAVIKQTS